MSLHERQKREESAIIIWLFQPVLFFAFPLVFCPYAQHIHEVLRIFVETLHLSFCLLGGIGTVSTSYMSTKFSFLTEVVLFSGSWQRKRSCLLLKYLSVCSVLGEGWEHFISRQGQHYMCVVTALPVSQSALLYQECWLDLFLLPGIWINSVLGIGLPSCLRINHILKFKCLKSTKFYLHMFMFEMLWVTDIHSHRHA